MNEMFTSISLSNLKQRTAQQVELIESVLRDIKPIQTRMLGEKTVRSIAMGARFEAIKGGRRLNFMEVIGVLSNIATLTQIIVLAVIGIRKMRAEAAWKAEYREEAKKVIAEKIEKSAELRELGNLIASDPVIVDRIIDKITTDPRFSKTL